MTTHSHARPAPRRLRPFLIIAPPAAALGALSASAASSTAFVLAGAVWGVVWTALAVLVAPMLRRRARSTAFAGGTMLTAAFVTALTLGAGLVQHLMYPTPEAYLALMRSNAAEGATGLYMMINPLLEWLLIPSAVALSWPYARQRRLLLVGATVYYLQRLTTYLYFAPTVLGWTENSDAVPVSRVGLWLDLDLARMTLDLAVIAILAAAVLRSRGVPTALMPGGRHPSAV